MARARSVATGAVGVRLQRVAGAEEEQLQPGMAVGEAGHRVEQDPGVEPRVDAAAPHQEHVLGREPRDGGTDDGPAVGDGRRSGDEVPNGTTATRPASSGDSA